MASGPVLLVVLALTIAFIIWSTARLKLHPVLALLAAAYGVGLLAGLPPATVAQSVGEGFGTLMTSIGLVIVAGTIIGACLERSGAALVMADAVLRFVGPQRPRLAMSVIGYIVSIPVFCDSGFVLLSPLNRALARRAGAGLHGLAVALATGLYATHTLVPPTPGPLAAAASLGASNLALVIGVGLIVALPTTLAGLAWSGHVARRHGTVGDPGPSADGEAAWARAMASFERLPGTASSFAPIVVPLVLIAVASVAALPGVLEDGTIRAVIVFIGHPLTALLVGVVLGLLLAPRLDEPVLSGWIQEALRDAAVILVVTGAGGSLGRMLTVTGVGTYLGEALSRFDMGLLLPFTIAAAIKTAQGSSTVSMVTTSALVTPLLGGLGLDSDLGRTLAVMATGAGAMCVSHANDSYFWVVSQFSDMSVTEAYRAHTIATAIQAGVAIITVLVLGMFLL